MPRKLTGCIPVWNNDSNGEKNQIFLKEQAFVLNQDHIKIIF